MSTPCRNSGCHSSCILFEMLIHMPDISPAWLAIWLAQCLQTTNHSLTTVPISAHFASKPSRQNNLSFLSCPSY